MPDGDFNTQAGIEKRLEVTAVIRDK